MVSVSQLAPTSASCSCKQRDEIGPREGVAHPAAHAVGQVDQHVARVARVVDGLHDRLAQGDAGIAEPLDEVILPALQEGVIGQDQIGVLRRFVQESC